MHWRVRIGISLLWLVATFSTVASQDSRTSSEPAASAAPVEDPRLQYMVLVPAGEFHMGSLEGDSFAEGDEQPQRVLHLPDFFIDKLEVSNIEYKRFTDATGFRVPEHWKDRQYESGADFLPVSGVSWWDAMAYARYMGKRLPTEAEWEKAACGTDARRFPWGDEFDDDLANVGKDYEQVASYFAGAGPYQVLNMAGNVAEWTATAYEPYPTIELGVPDAFGGTATATQPVAAREVQFDAVNDKDLSRARVDYEEGDPLLQFFTIDELADRRQRVYRGGSINNYTQYLRCANREKSKPGDRWYNIGFRCAMDPPTVSGK